MQGGHLVAFECQKLNGAKKQYNMHEKEMTVGIHFLQQ